MPRGALMGEMMDAPTLEQTKGKPVEWGERWQRDDEVMERRGRREEKMVRGEVRKRGGYGELRLWRKDLIERKLLWREVEEREKEERTLWREVEEREERTLWRERFWIGKIEERGCFVKGDILERK